MIKFPIFPYGANVSEIDRALKAEKTHQKETLESETYVRIAEKNNDRGLDKRFI